MPSDCVVITVLNAEFDLLGDLLAVPTFNPPFCVVLVVFLTVVDFFVSVFFCCFGLAVSSDFSF